MWWLLHLRARKKQGVRTVEELFDERSGDGRRRVWIVDDGLAGWLEI